MRGTMFTLLLLLSVPPVSEEIVVEFISGMAGCWDRLGAGLGVVGEGQVYPSLPWKARVKLSGGTSELDRTREGRDLDQAPGCSRRTGISLFS